MFHTFQRNKVIVDYLQVFNPIKIGIFGSYARNESRPDSDLVDLNIVYQTVAVDIPILLPVIEKILG
jgi:predicted nucleotidyltransferase